MKPFFCALILDVPYSVPHVSINTLQYSMRPIFMIITKLLVSGDVQFTMSKKQDCDHSIELTMKWEKSYFWAQTLLGRYRHLPDGYRLSPT